MSAGETGADVAPMADRSERAERQVPGTRMLLDGIEVTVVPAGRLIPLTEANVMLPGGSVHTVGRDRLTPVAADKGLAERHQLRAWLREATEAEWSEPCHLDHHGDCQAHGHGAPCPIPAIRDYFAVVTP